MTENMSSNMLHLINLSRVIFFIANIWLSYSFLTSKRPLTFQIIAFTSTWASIYWLRNFFMSILPDHFLVGYILSLLYLIPFALVFEETLFAKMFVFFMVFSFFQCSFLIFLYLELLVFNQMVGGILFSGLLLELLCIPFIRKHGRYHITNILEVIDQQNPCFIVFPIISFVMLAFYGAERTYSLSTFIPLVLCTFLIAFSYYLIAVSIDQTKRRQQLEFISRTDSLTGLYNRRHMEQKIKEEYERYQRTGVEFALIIGDIDFFKNVNDRYGHDCGDWVLKLIADDFQKITKEYDTVARWGGEEFLLLLPMTNGENAFGVAERIRKTVEERKYMYKNQALSLTLTLGVSVIRSGDTIASVSKKADLALYQGKQSGRNCVKSFEQLGHMALSAIN